MQTRCCRDLLRTPCKRLARSAGGRAALCRFSPSGRRSRMLTIGPSCIRPPPNLPSAKPNRPGWCCRLCVGCAVLIAPGVSVIFATVSPQDGRYRSKSGEGQECHGEDQGFSFCFQAGSRAAGFAIFCRSASRFAMFTRFRPLIFAP
jgi:hypothetical protein